MKLDYSEIERMCDDAIAQLQTCTRKIGALSKVRPKVLPNTRIIEGAVNEMVIQKNRTSLVTGIYFVQKGAVSAISHDTNSSACVVVVGDIIVIPEGFYIHAILKSKLVRCKADDAQYATFISDQMTFASRLITYSCYENVKWVCSKLDVASAGMGFKINITALAKAIGSCRASTGRAISRMVRDGTMERVKIKYHAVTHRMTP